MEIILLPLHLLTLLFVAWNVFHADHMGFNWIRGKVQMLDEKDVMKYHKRTWAGLITMIITGLFLFWGERDVLLARPQFWIKMGFVLALFLNSFAIGSLSKIALTKPYTSVSGKEKMQLMLSGAISTISWLSAALMAFFISPE